MVAMTLGCSGRPKRNLEELAVFHRIAIRCDPFADAYSRSAAHSDWRIWNQCTRLPLSPRIIVLWLKRQYFLRMPSVMERSRFSYLNGHRNWCHEIRLHG